MSNPRPGPMHPMAPVPLFPLPGVVFFPHTLLPLHVFEPRYRALVEDALRGDRMIAVPCLSDGWEAQYDDAPQVLPVCGVGRIVRHQELDDGRHHVVLLGLARARIVEETDGPEPYRRAVLEHLPDAPMDSPNASRDIIALRALVGGLANAADSGRNPFRLALDARRSRDEFTHIIAHLVLRTPETRQHWLEQERPESRLDALITAVVALGHHADTAPEA